MISKCVHRLLLEQKLNDGYVPKEEDKRCERCYGFERTCPDYTDLAHLMNFYQLFKQDKQITQK